MNEVQEEKLCNLVPHGKFFRCSVCGLNVLKPREIKCKPRGQSSQLTLSSKPPGKVRRVTNYTRAVNKWIAAGAPTRTQEEIERILRICEGCQHFSNKTTPRCDLCGCRVNNSPNGFRNKIAMATESCPHDPPYWEAEVK